MKPIIPDYKGVNSGHYSPGMMVGNTLYISGQLPLDMDTRKLVGEDISTQARQVLINLDRVLEAAGMTRRQVVSVRVYIAGIEHWDSVNTVYSEYFGEHKPTRAIVPVLPLHFGSLVELEAIAVKED